MKTIPSLYSWAYVKGYVAMTGVANLLLHTYAKKTVDFGVLKAQAQTVGTATRETLTQATASHKSNGSLSQERDGGWKEPENTFVG